MIKHSILIITYNQERFIKECIDSVMNQDLEPYEIIVSDDCSSDKTWDIILEYRKRYPELFKVYRHDKNIGVYPNFNFVLSVASGDIINFVAGDDMLPKGILKKYSDYIISKNVDCNDAFIIFTNSLILKPHGKIVLKDNSKSFCENKMIERCLISCLWSWETGISKGLIKKMQERGISGIRENLGYQADLLWYLEKIINSDKLYYINEIGYIYRANVGVSVATKWAEHKISKQKVIDVIKNEYAIYLNEKIYRYFKFDYLWHQYNETHKFKDYMNFLISYITFGKFPHGSIFRNPLKIIPPISVKNVIKKYRVFL